MQLGCTISASPAPPVALIAMGLTSTSDVSQSYCVIMPVGVGQSLCLPSRSLNHSLNQSLSTGLFNQMYAHIAAWILADVLGADVIMPPSLYRNSYGSQYSIHGVSELKWLPTNISSLLDMEGVRQGYEARGRQVYEHPLTITEAPESSSLSESGGIGEECASHPQSAYLSGSIPESGLTFDPYQIVRMNDVYMRASSLDAIWDEAANLIMKKHESLLASGRSPATPILLDLPSAFFSIMTITCLDRARLAVLALPFNLTLLSLASRIVRRIKRGGRDQFNGIHFRFERDAADWIEAYGGAEAYLDLYLRTAKGAGLDTSHRDLYVASGLLSYADEEERKWLHDILGPYGRKLIYKESGKIQKITRNVTGGSLEDLNTEQRALVDFLVLAHSHVFVGLGTSSFSVYLREYRRIHGLGEEGRGGNVFVSSKSVGTDSLFQRCGHLGEIKN